MRTVAERLGGRRLGEEEGVFNIKSQEKVLPWVTNSCYGSDVSAVTGKGDCNSRTTVITDTGINSISG